jgi:signal transduction histidine kinase
MLAAYHRDPLRVAAAWELEKRYPPRQDSPHGAPAVIRSGEPEIIAELDDATLRAFARDAEHLSILRCFGVRSLLCVPMVARSRTLGAMIFAMVESGRTYRWEDVPLATEIARRAAIAIDHAKMYELARQAIAVREDFLSIASHELKTPLTALQLSVQRLQRSAGTDGSLGPASASMLATVDRSTRRLAQLVDDLLDISRLMTQKTTFEYEDVDVFGVVPEVVSDARDMLGKAGCSVTVTGDGDGIGHWNRDRLRLVMNNLLSNAAKYGPNRPIEVTIAPALASIKISVADHGIGIPKEMQGRIFERFERAVSEREYGGFGLGLWIVKQIVEGFGGKVEVASEPGQGSTFTVVLPRNPVVHGPAEVHGISA